MIGVFTLSQQIFSILANHCNHLGCGDGTGDQKLLGLNPTNGFDDVWQLPACESFKVSPEGSKMQLRTTDLELVECVFKITGLPK